MVGVEYSNMPVLAPWPGNHPMSGVQLKVQQTFPFPTKLSARAAAASAAQRALEPLAREAKNRLAAAVRRGFARYERALALRKINTEHVAATERLLTAARARYEVGRADQQDLLKLELLRERLREEARDLDAEAAALRADLNSLAGRPADAPLAAAAEPRVAVVDGDADALVARAEEGRPLAQALARQGEAAHKQATAAREDVWPDVTAWLGYRVRLPAGTDRGDNFVTAGVSVPITSPWSGVREDADARAAEANAEAKRAERRALLRMLRGRISSTLVRYTRARDRAAAHDETLIPQAERTLESAFSAYRVDRATFSDLFTAEVDLLNLSRARVESLTAAALAAVDLNELVGAAAAPDAAEQEQP
jgi:cobalt-zinc-cadmium efflux system outer membrane protein